MAATNGSATLPQLQEENYSLRMQVTKLQVALRKASKRDGPGTTGSPRAASGSKQQMELVMGELATLREQVNQLHDENRSLQAQLHNMREAQPASTSGTADEEPWTGARQDAFSRGDMAFIEREILCLKQKLTETRQKLNVSEQQPPPPQPPDGAPPTQLPGSSLRRMAAAVQGGRSPLQQQPPPQPQQHMPHPVAAPTHRTGVLQQVFRRNDSFSFFPQPPIVVPTMAPGPARPLGVTGARTAAPRARVGQPQSSNKKAGPAVPSRALKENRANAAGSVNPAARGKVQRGRSVAC